MRESVLTSTLASSSTDDDDDFSHAAPVGLSGRSDECLVLIRSFLEVNQTRSYEKLVLHGESGTGKTTFVCSVVRQCLRNKNNQGHFVSGKFFAVVDTQEPYSAILAAFSDLIDLILQQGDFVDARREQALKKLGKQNVLLLSKAVSGFNTLFRLDHQRCEDEEELEGTNSSCESQNSVDGLDQYVSLKNLSMLSKFKLACKQFLLVMAELSSGPVILFIDDIQWMDPGSSDLLRLLLEEDSELRNVFLILAYREEDREVVEEKLLKDIKPSQNDENSVVDIRLRNLGRTTVHEMITSYLNTSADKTMELSELVWQKTNGNPFHVVQFLETIQRRGFLCQSASALRHEWVFDVAEIQQQMPVSDNLATLLSHKVQTLPSKIQEMLTLASMMGYEFEDSVLSQAVDNLLHCKEAEVSERITLSTIDSDTLPQLLEDAANEVFIEKTRNGFQFSHDKLHSQFLALVGQNEKELYHYIIGQAYATKAAHHDLELSYQAAIHLNSAISRISSPKESVELVNCNLRAARYCEDKAAFTKAIVFLTQGLSLLDKEPMSKWTEHYELAFDMTERRAKMEMIIGNFEVCKQVAGEALERARSVHMKINSIIIDIEARMAGNPTINTVDVTVAATHAALGMLGISVPARITKRHAILKLFKVRCLVGRKTDLQILSLRIVRDRAIVTAVKLLSILCIYCLTKKSEVMALYMALVGTELTLTRGLTQFGATVMSVYGITEMMMGRQSQGYRLANLGQHILGKIPSDEATGPTNAMATSFLLHWKQPVRQLVELIDNSFEVGIDTGDVVCSVYHLVNYVALRLVIGTNLKKVEEFMFVAYKRLNEIRNDSMIGWVHPAMQFVLNLQSEALAWRDVVVLNGSIMNEMSFMSHADVAGLRQFTFTCRFYKVQLLYHFGFYEFADSVLRDIDDIASVRRLHYYCPEWWLYGALTYYELYRITGSGTHIRKARKYHKRLRKIQSNPNAPPYLVFLQAEKLAYAKKGANVDQVVEAYDAAVTAMRECEYPHLEGLANERASFFLARQQSHEQATDYFTRALGLYRHSWGARAKYEWLMTEYKDEITGNRGYNNQAAPLASVIIVDTSQRGEDLSEVLTEC